MPYAQTPRKKTENPGTVPRIVHPSCPKHYNCTVGLPKSFRKVPQKNWAAHSHITQQEMKTKRIRQDDSQFKVITAPDQNCS